VIFGIFRSGLRSGGTVAEWFIAIGTVSAVAAAAGYYIFDKRTERRKDDVGALRRWLSRLQRLATLAKSRGQDKDPDGCQKILEAWNDYASTRSAAAKFSCERADPRA
jgi:hypothetical protein